jgi:hypothetical protein
LRPQLAVADFFFCASFFFLQERVAREMATNPKQEAFYKEMPTYQADLNEALLGFFMFFFCPKGGVLQRKEMSTY